MCAFSWYHHMSGPRSTYLHGFLLISSVLIIITFWVWAYTTTQRTVRFFKQSISNGPFEILGSEIFNDRLPFMYFNKSLSVIQINKQTHRMYHLLAICLVLHPQCIDESIQQVLREEKYHEKMYKMQYGDLNVSCFFFTLLQL